MPPLRVYFRKHFLGAKCSGQTALMCSKNRTFMPASYIEGKYSTQGRWSGIIASFLHILNTAQAQPPRPPGAAHEPQGKVKPAMTFLARLHIVQLHLDNAIILRSRTMLKIHVLLQLFSTFLLRKLQLLFCFRTGLLF